MTRIIAGNLGSLRLKTAAKATRPTSDRVKESVFAKLEIQGALEGARVLDLFAGTGALGLEAISRGASSLVLVEKNLQALSVLKANVQLIREGLRKQKIEAEISVVSSDAGKFLQGAQSDSLDLVFVDPPYEFGNQVLEELFSKLVKCISKGGLVVLERSVKSELPNHASLEVTYEKLYGDTKVWFLQKN